MLKVDVEGFELPVLQGASATLRDPSLRAIVIEVNGSGGRYGFDQNIAVELLRACGFESMRYDPFSRTVAAPARAVSTGGNALFVRDMEWVMSRLSTAPSWTVNNGTI